MAFPASCGRLGLEFQEYSPRSKHQFIWPVEHLSIDGLVYPVTALPSAEAKLTFPGGSE